MDLSVQCERTIADETESNKGSKVFNHLTSGNDNEYVEGDPVCSSLAANVKERLVLKSTANGLVNGTLNDNSDCSIKVIKTKGDKSEDCLENPHRNSRTVVQEPHKAETICTSEELSETKYAIDYVGYESEKQMPDIMRLIQKDLSEPYSIYTYRYFIHNWPKLCFLAMFQGECIGAIVCKLDFHRKVAKRGYIAMLAVDEKYRKQKIGSKLVQLAIQGMVNDKADEVVLETEITNQPALRLYENLGFVRDKRLFRYYLNGVDALRLKLWLR